MSLTLAEARARAGAVADVAYELDLDLTDPGQQTFGCRTRVRFTASESSTFLELTGANGLTVTLDGEPVDPAYDGRRIHLAGLGGAHQVDVAARLPYVTDGDGMHAFTDPADGETYVCAYVGMDIAQRVLCCFDQNDLKAPVALSVTADPAWTVLANGRPSSHQDGHWRFATTPPIPVAMFVVCAGPWHSRTWEHGGLPFGWHARRSLAAELDRDFDELRRTTGACFDHYAEQLSEPMPFDSYDQAFVPGQNWGALETPGCVTYRDEYLPRGRVTDRMRASRATTIAHEMAHMWFGDLVTMTWWEDTWLQESFADYMGYRVAEAAAGYPDLLVGLETTRKVTAYEADARRSTHPVAPRPEDVPDVDAAATNFDMISYAKGNAALRQLVTWLGEDTFRAGLDRYLTRHRFGNATLTDFLAALDEVSDRDVSAWAATWLRTSGFDTVRVEREGGSDDVLEGVPVLRRVGSRPHRVGVTAYDETLRPLGSRVVDLGAQPVRLAEWSGRVVLPNSGAETFARLALDPASAEALMGGVSDLGDPLARAVVWGHLFDRVHQRDLAPSDYLDVVAAQLPREADPTIVTSVLARTRGRVLPLRVPADRVDAATTTVADACATGLEQARTDELRLAFLEGLATSTRDQDRLHQWLDQDGLEGLSMPTSLRWRIVARLAAVGGADATFVETERRRDGTVDGELGAVRALAARPTPEAKLAAWAALTEPDVSNRRFESVAQGLWQVEQLDLVGPYVDRYLDEAPQIAAHRGQAFAQVVGRAFPAVPLSQAQVAALERQLSEGVPTVLQRLWEDALDDLR